MSLDPVHKGGSQIFDRSLKIINTTNIPELTEPLD